MPASQELAVHSQSEKQTRERCQRPDDTVEVRAEISVPWLGAPLPKGAGQAVWAIHGRVQRRINRGRLIMGFR